MDVAAFAWRIVTAGADTTIQNRDGQSALARLLNQRPNRFSLPSGEPFQTQKCRDTRVQLVQLLTLDTLAYGPNIPDRMVRMVRYMNVCLMEGRYDGSWDPTFYFDG